MPATIPVEYTSERLLLRRYHPSDAPTYYAALCENQAHLKEFLPPNLMNVNDVDVIRSWIKWQVQEWLRRRLYILSLWEKSSGEYVGEVYLANPDWDVPSIEVGYFTLQNYGGRGYAVEACRYACGIAFDLLGVRRVELQCSADNAKSISVARRCGFTLEGCLRERNHKKDDTIVDRLWFGLLRSEWEDSLAK